MKWIVALVLCAAGTVTAEPAVYLIRPAEGASFRLEVYKTGLMSGKKHVFRFDRYEGRLRYDPADPESAGIRLAIEAGSAVCEDTWVSEKQRADILKYALEDMMDAARHPQLVFESNAVRRAGDGRFQVDGMLTVRGKAKPLTVAVRLGEPGGALRLEGSAVVNLKDYGIKPRSAFLGVIGTKREMTARFVLIGTRP